MWFNQLLVMPDLSRGLGFLGKVLVSTDLNKLKIGYNYIFSVHEIKSFLIYTLGLGGSEQFFVMSCASHKSAQRPPKHTVVSFSNKLAQRLGLT